MGQVDSGLLHFVNGWPESLAPGMRFLSEATNYGWVRAVLGVLALAMLVRGRRSRATILMALVAFPLADLTTNILKKTFPVHRPFQVEEVILRLGASDSMGTASAHSANMAAVAFVFVRTMGVWGIPWAVLAFLVGLSRVYCGVHYPSQVVLGWLCGIGIAWLVTMAYERIWPQRASPDSGREVDEPEIP